MRTKTLGGFLALLSLLGVVTQAAPLGTAFTYQGQLSDGPNPAHGIYDLRFTIYAAGGGGSAVAGPITNSLVDVTNGLFTLTLDFGPEGFAGEACWLEIGVRTNGGGAFTTLTPRQELTPSPAALYAPSAGVAATAATAASAAAVAANGVANISLQAGAVTTDKIADGTLTVADLSPVLAANTFWRLDGNQGTSPGAQFLGTTDNRALELRANARRVLRLEPDPVNDAPNLIAGSSSNTVVAGVVGAVIAGGGRGLQPNRVFGAWGVISGGEANVVSNHYDVVGGGFQNTVSGGFSTVSGGSDNLARGGPLGRATVGGGLQNTAIGSGTVVGGGQENWADQDYASIGGGLSNTNFGGHSAIGGGVENTIQDYGLAATIGGGWRNNIEPHAYYAVIGGGEGNTIHTSAVHAVIGGGRVNQAQQRASTIGGGWNNRADGEYASVGGGSYNSALDDWATIGGGRDQLATNAYATVPGGRNNLAGGMYSLAAGRRAQALHAGAFVWADSTDADWASTADNQFLIRASGGVGIGIGSPEQMLHVGGDTLVRGTNFTPAGHTARLILGDANHTLRGVYGAGLRFGVWPDADALVIEDGSGNVGVGLTNPATKLDVAGTVTAAGFNGSGAGLTSLRASSLGSGTVTGTLHFAPSIGAPFTVGSQSLVSGLNADLLDGWHSSHYWQLNGNHGLGAGDFLGTTDHSPVEIRVNGLRALRLEDNGDSSDENTSSDGSPNVIGGAMVNYVAPGVVGATISGGGATNHNDIVWSNSVFAPFATISGGLANSAHAVCSSISGGANNTIESWSGISSISGGYYNTIGPRAAQAAIGGGWANAILPDGICAVIPGGMHNSAGLAAFAAGCGAKAIHSGAFVWADHQETDFASTRSNEFNIRAGGGVRIKSERGIRLEPFDGPLITRGHDPFADTAPLSKQAHGRWGVFMEPHALVLGMPDAGGKTVQFGKYALDGTYTPLAQVDQSGNLYTAGAVNPPSDRAVKQDFEAVNPQTVLARLIGLPLQSWAYTNNPSVRHLGPVAQDFHAAFGLGTDDKHIATVDADGVALAAIQGLNQRLNEQESEIQELKRVIAELKATVIPPSVR